MDSHHKLLMHSCIFEMVGTAILPIAYNLTADTPAFQIPAVCAAVLAVVTVMGPVSGGHANPAISLGLLVGHTGTKDLKQEAFKTLCLVVS